MCSDLFVAYKTIENARRVRFGHFQRNNYFNLQPGKICGFSRVAFSRNGVDQFPLAPRMASSTETPAVSLPTQEQVEQAAGSLYSAASTVLDAILGASGN